MRPARSVAEYVGRPVGRYVAGATFAHVFVDARLCGLILWGRPDEAAAIEMTRAIEAELTPRGPHASFVDARRITGIDTAAFRVLSEHLAANGPRYTPRITRHALIHGSGATGAVVAGFYRVTPLVDPTRTQVFGDAETALAWLGRDDVPALLALIDRLAAADLPDVVRRVRDQVTAAPRTGVAEAARALGVSSRALQDHLRRAGTTFRKEATAAKLAIAERLLLDSDAKLDVVAREIGCASAQHFATLFRRATGESPSAFRQRRTRLRAGSSD